MEIRKTKPRSSLEQKANENIVSTENILDEIKAIYLSQKDTKFSEKLNKLNE